MSILTFLFEAVLISLSGVMAPGPITAVTIGKGNESPHAGAMVALGHGIIEFPLMIFIFYGFGYLLNLVYVKALIGFIGGLFLSSKGGKFFGRKFQKIIFTICGLFLLFFSIKFITDAVRLLI